MTTEAYVFEAIRTPRGRGKEDAPSTPFRRLSCWPGCFTRCKPATNWIRRR